MIFLAFQSAKGQISVNPVSATGRLYQKLIYKGFSTAKNFISVSKNTQAELEALLPKPPQMSTYVYNGLNPLFETGDRSVARKALGDQIGRSLEQGFMLHVGGNQFYKNRIGILHMYCAWRDRSAEKQPLILIGTAPTKALTDFKDQSKYANDILFCSGA